LFFYKQNNKKDVSVKKLEGYEIYKTAMLCRCINKKPSSKVVSQVFCAQKEKNNYTKVVQHRTYF